MEKRETITNAIGIVGILSLFLAGGSYFMDESQLSSAYVCSINENVAFFDSLSSTHKTGYYINELNESKRKVCTNGQWISLKEYAKEKGIGIDQLLKQSFDNPVVNSGSIKYRCDQEKCVRI